MKITKEFIDKGRGPKGGLTARQKNLLGVGNNPSLDWEKKIIGEQISDLVAREFLIKSGNASTLSRSDAMRRFGARSTRGMCR